MERAEAARAPRVADQAPLKLAARRFGQAAWRHERDRRRLDLALGDHRGPHGLGDSGQCLRLRPGATTDLGDDDYLLQAILLCAVLLQPDGGDARSPELRMAALSRVLEVVGIVVAAPDHDHV